MARNVEGSGLRRPLAVKRLDPGRPSQELASPLAVRSKLNGDRGGRSEVRGGSPEGNLNKQITPLATTKAKSCKSRLLHFAKIQDPPVPRWTGEIQYFAIGDS